VNNVISIEDLKSIIGELFIENQFLRREIERLRIEIERVKAAVESSSPRSEPE
jgi:regulator of replication initiation timing